MYSQICLRFDRVKAVGIQTTLGLFMSAAGRKVMLSIYSTGYSIMKLTANMNT